VPVATSASRTSRCGALCPEMQRGFERAVNPAEDSGPHSLCAFMWPDSKDTALAHPSLGSIGFARADDQARHLRSAPAAPLEGRPPWAWGGDETRGARGGRAFDCRPPGTARACPRRGPQPRPGRRGTFGLARMAPPCRDPAGQRAPGAPPFPRPGSRRYGGSRGLGSSNPPASRPGASASLCARDDFRRRWLPLRV